VRLDDLSDRPDGQRTGLSLYHVGDGRFACPS